MQRVGSFRSRLKKQNPICMAEPPPIFVETPSKSAKPPGRHAKPTMVVLGPSISVDSASSLGLLPASRVAVSVQMCDDTAVASQAGHIILFKSTHSQPSYCVIPHYVTLTLIFALFLHFLLLLKCSLLLHHISSYSAYLVLSRYFFCVMFAGMLFPS